MDYLHFFEPVDYLVVGHVTHDVQPDNSLKLGGTVSFSGLTALALGQRVGVVTSCNPQTDLSHLAHTAVVCQSADQTTTFQNVSSPEGRKQFLYEKAGVLNSTSIPEVWRSTPIVHLGPVASEIDPEIHRAFPDSMICLTAQGWLRGVDGEQRVHPIAWPFDHELLKAAHAVVISQEDVRGHEGLIDEFAAMCRLLVVTENSQGALVYWNGDIHRFPAPAVPLVEDTGAGDIFAACFFVRLHQTRDPWEATRFAVQLAANSVTRRHFDSIPTPAEIEAAMTVIL